MELRGLTIPYAKNKAKKGREKKINTQKRMEELDNLISNSANADYITRQLKAEYITLKHIKMQPTNLQSEYIKDEATTTKT